MAKLLTLEEGLALNRRDMRELYREHINPGFTSLLSMLDSDKHFVKAKGPLVWDNYGNEYVDFLSGYGSLNLGHNHPVVLKAIETVKENPFLIQASISKLTAVMGYNLAQLAPGDLKNCFFCNSGDESIEGALKLARAATGRKKFIYCEGAFHGRTFGALSVSGMKKYRKPFQPLLPDCVEIPYGDLGALEKALKTKRAAAFIVEPIQCEAGIVMPARGYLQEAASLCSRYATLLIADEVQTGLGRCGEIFACNIEKSVPDVICLSNFLGGGLIPSGAFITTEKIWNKAFGGIDDCLLHNSTFGGNSWAMAAGIAALNEMVRLDLPRMAREKGNYLMEKLKKVSDNNKLIKDIRGIGLLAGIEFAPVTRGALNAFSLGIINKLGNEFFTAIITGELLHRHNIITANTLHNPNVIRLEPPLIITEKQIDRLVSALEATLNKNLSGILVNSSKTLIASIFNRKIR